MSTYLLPLCEDCREALFRLRDEPWTSPDRSAEPGHGTH